MITATFAFLIGALVIGVFRLIRGPSLPDRVVALDLIALSAVGLIGVYAVSVDQPAYIDEAMVLALIGFFGTVAFAYYIEKGGVPWRRS